MDAIPGVPRTMLEVRVRWVLLFVIAVANVGGGLVVLLFATFVVPDPPMPPGEAAQARLVNTIAFFSYPVIAGPIALALGYHLWRPVVRLAREGGTPDREQRRAVLLGPLRATLVMGALWTLGAIGWATLDIALFNVRLGVKTGLTALLGALTCCTIVYLLSERLLRPAAALVLATEHPRWFKLPGVTTRVMLAWALGTAIPVFGLICVAIGALAAGGIETTQLAITILGLGGTSLLVGMAVTYMATQAIADPIKTVRQGMAMVERGDLETEIEVYDASEVGQLQSGFNHMVAGLRDHERLRDLFGRHVGEEVAGLAIENGHIELGGETREVAVLFVDLTGSTRLAETHAPDEVVALLNQFFGVVVETVNGHGGWINKFEGDAALAIFGAPTDLDDAAGAALGAARELAFRLRTEVPGVDAGIGVSAGPVVAGYIGAEQRFEYTVIGDPVNEAARLSDLAKVAPGRVLASGTVLELAHLAEAAEWDLGKSVTLRGRSRPTRLAAPRTPVVPTVVESVVDEVERRRRLFPRPRVPGLLRRVGRTAADVVVPPPLASGAGGPGGEGPEVGVSGGEGPGLPGDPGDPGDPGASVPSAPPVPPRLPKAPAPPEPMAAPIPAASPIPGASPDAGSVARPPFPMPPVRAPAVSGTPKPPKTPKPPRTPKSPKTPQPPARTADSPGVPRPGASTDA
ncbi:adenylate/guanylate cyclase domain-containing protein [Spirillospora sp. NPDC047279]|uniref:adenylate/guanylate cyclase domain-containing protein n=1 Tax=Spirillospora sp. NPDC047279 TaxID=3155478 RepID=UPI0033FEB552